MSEMMQTTEIEKRACPRVLCDIEEIEGKGKIGDVSASGVHLHSRTDFEINQEVDLKFIVPRSEQKVLAKGVVRRKHETKIKSLMGYGIQFVASENDQETIHIIGLFVKIRQESQPTSTNASAIPTDDEHTKSIPQKTHSRRTVQSGQVVITGIGCLTAISSTVQEFWLNLLAGKSAIKMVEDPFMAGSRYPLAVIEGFDLSKFQDNEYYMRLRYLRDARKKCFVGREVDLQLASIGLALRDTHVEYNRELNRIGVVLGTEMPGFVGTERGYTDLVNETRNHPDLPVSEVVLNFYKKYIQTYVNTLSFSDLYYATCVFGLHGPSTTVNSASASGLSALHQAVLNIQNGDSEVMLACASEDLMDSSLRYHLFKRFGVYSDDGRLLPWDIDRHGSVMGEAAVALVIEDKEHAVRRGAKIYAEIKSSIMTQDGAHYVSPDYSVRYLAQAHQEACQKAGIPTDEIDLVLPHQTGTQLNDQIQADVIKLCFPHDPYVASFSPQIGHPLCASGLLRVIYGALALQHQTVPPTTSIQNLDPKCDLRVTSTPVRTKLRNVACNAISYGGNNAALILSAAS